MKTTFSRGSVLSETLWWICCCLLSCVCLTNGSDGDVVEVQYTVYSDQNKTLQFQQTTLFNGQVIFSCSKTNTPVTRQDKELKDQLRQDWVANVFTQDALQERHKQCDQQYYHHKAWLTKIEESITVTGVILQRRRGCMTNSSGVFRFDKWGVNGQDFLTFDPDTLKWTPLSEKAKPLAVEWNGQNLMNGAYRQFVQKLCNDTCILKVKQLEPTGLDLNVFFKPIPGGKGTFFCCHVTNSDLSEVRIELTQDGVPLTSGLNLTGPRPNGDGTSQMRLQLETTVDSSSYQCEVHSKTANMSEAFDNQSPPRRNATVIVICVVLGIALCVGVLIYLRAAGVPLQGFTQTPTDDANEGGNNY